MPGKLRCQLGKRGPRRCCDRTSVPHCTSTLLRNDNATATRFDDLHLVCSKCGEHAEPEDVFEDALGRSIEWDAYEAAKEGLNSPLKNCPECDRDMFVVGEGRCASCGFSLKAVNARCAANR